MHDDLLALIERKLKEAFRSADEKALGHIRDKWSGIGPAPSCPSLDQMMKELNELIHRALTDRGEIARQVVIATLDSVPLKLTDYFTSRVSGKLPELFPDDVYLSTASNTLKVYQRRRAPANKYSEGAFEHQMPLIRVGCRNLAVRARASIDTALAERLLRDKASVPIESATLPEIRPSPLTRMSGIFISYRREDSADAAGRLYDRLSAHFGREHVFMDIDAIEPGVDFVELINEKVASCDVLIAVIGRNWLMSLDDKGRRRLDNPEDFVHLEIAAALDRKIRLIPALVGGASMPRVGLPNALAKLAQRHAIEISHTRFHQDVDRLIKALEKIIPAVKGRDLSKVEPGRTVQLGINRSFFMPIDAVFQISGRGMVAVGIVKSGTCRIGQEVVLLKDDAELRRCEVASIEAFGKILDKAQAGDRVGILLLGIASKAEIEPGMVLASLG